VTTALSPRMPYPGLRSFRREESDLFFGREDCINTMVDRLAATRFLAVLGSSGTGKSSVVKTGLLDALDLGIMTQAGSSWRVVDFRPGSAPLENLARRLLETKPAQPSASVSATDVDLLRAFLVRGPRSVVEWCGDGHLPEHTNLLLLVDQFEELFRYQDYAGREEAEAFAALLIESARSSRFPIYVVLTMRSEYLGACALIDGLAEAISTGMFLTPRMTREQCRAAIVGPAAVCGVKIEEALVSRLLNDLAAFAPWDDRGSRDQLDRLVRRADQLPLLQYCLNRMFVRAQGEPRGGAVTLTLADYERIGGLSGALNAHADEILRTLGSENQPVAEAAFRALTEGSTVSDAVRRPTRLRELVDICGADEATVRAIVDAFRAPGCNFLAPELDPNNPKPLDMAAVVDISHESLIRQWKQLSEWLDKEARSVRQWRRLKDLFEDGKPMGSIELANTQAWLRTQNPNAAWVRRHGGELPSIMKFVQRSERRERRFAPVMLPLYGVGAFFVGAILATVVSAYVDPSNPTWPWQFNVPFYAAFAASTCAIGLWRYRGFDTKRSVLAGVSILVLGIVSGAAFGGILVAHNGTTGDAIHFWLVLFIAPCTLIGLAIFEPIYRRFLTWTLLVALFVILARGQALLSLTTNTHNILLLSAFFIWFAAIGYPLRSSGELADEGDPKWPRLAPLQLPLLFMACFLTLVLWEKSALSLHYGATEPSWSWLVDIAFASAPVAIACGFGLWRLAGLDRWRAAMAGAVIFVLQYASGAVLIAILQSHDVPRLTAYDWWGATSFAPCVMLVLALFEPSFRRIAVWAPLAILFAAPPALSIWLKAHAPDAIANAAVGLLSLVVSLLWLAAIGYQLQRARRKQATSGEVRNGEGRGRRRATPGPSANQLPPKLAAE
jgi:hypothetical protein